MEKQFYIISVDKTVSEESKLPSIEKAMLESWLKAVKKDKNSNLKVVKVSDPEMGILLDALFGQTLEIEKDCKKLGRKIETVCNDFKI